MCIWVYITCNFKLSRKSTINRLLWFLENAMQIAREFYLLFTLMFYMIKIIKYFVTEKKRKKNRKKDRRGNGGGRRKKKCKKNMRKQFTTNLIRQFVVEFQRATAQLRDRLGGRSSMAASTFHRVVAGNVLRHHSTSLKKRAAATGGAFSTLPLRVC